MASSLFYASNHYPLGITARMGSGFLPALLACILAFLEVLTSHPELFWGLIVSIFIGNLFLVILNIPLIGMWVKLLFIPYHLMFPAIVLFTCIGVYSTSNSTFDIWVLLAFGVFISARLPPRRSPCVRAC